MAKKKTEPIQIRTVADMQRIPFEKVEWFCEDLRLWLSLCRMAEANGMAVKGDNSVFRWIDDGRHDVNVRVHVHPVAVAQDVTPAAQAAEPRND